MTKKQWEKKRVRDTAKEKAPEEEESKSPTHRISVKIDPDIWKKRDCEFSLKNGSKRLEKYKEWCRLEIERADERYDNELKTLTEKFNKLGGNDDFHMDIITEPCASNAAALDFLDELHYNKGIAFHLKKTKTEYTDCVGVDMVFAPPPIVKDIFGNDELNITDSC